MPLPITIPDKEYYDEAKEEFVTVKGAKLVLEHSLVSLSKWESKWKKAFLSSREEKTREESIDYIRCMTITQNVDPAVYSSIDNDIMAKIMAYIDDPMTATWFNEREEKRARVNRETITSELIYFWMTQFNIPWECQKWHLNRLLTLIKVCSIKSQDPKKMNKRDVMQQNRALNAARRAKHHTRG